MRRLNFEEISYAVRFGGKIGLCFLLPPSLVITLLPFLGAYGLDEAVVSKYVRFGFEIFLMGGWGAGAISISRQTVARLFGRAAGILVGTATGSLVTNLMAVIFLSIAGDAPSLGTAAIGGLASSIAVSVILDRRAA